VHRASGAALAELRRLETAQEVAADLKLIYRAATEAEAEQRLAEFSLKWDAKFPMIAKSWRSNWARVIPLFAHPPEIRKVIYTTNAIESLTVAAQVTKRGARFPTTRPSASCSIWRCATLPRSGPCRSTPGKTRSTASPSSTKPAAGG